MWEFLASSDLWANIVGGVVAALLSPSWYFFGISENIEFSKTCVRLWGEQSSIEILAKDVHIKIKGYEFNKLRK